MLETLSRADATPAAIADHYGDLLTGFVGEEGDVLPSERLPCHATRTVMATRDDSLRLARAVLSFAEQVLATRTP
jgi:hypothetical protein